VRTIENYVDFDPQYGVDEDDTDCDVVVEYEYSAGRLVTLTATNAKGNDSDPENENVEAQATKYLYGSSVNASWQTVVVYPDSDDVLTQGVDGTWSFTTDNGDHVSTDYDRSGRVVGTTDQRGVVHEYVFDSAGRLEADTVDLTYAPASVDDSVLAIVTGYDDLGRVETVTSYTTADDEDWDAGHTVNQVKYEYNGWGRLAREYQEHDGPVDGSTLHVDYTYESPRVSGEGDHEPVKYVRLSQVTYPNERDVNYDYGTAGAIDDVMSRLAAVKDDDGSTVLASYKYLGAGRVVEEDYEDAEVKLDYAHDDLAGLDRFGRVVDQLWQDYDAEEPIDKYTYTYDEAGNRTSKDNELHSAFDEDYTYDDLDRLATTTRADGFDQSWDLDGLGNWAVFDDDGTSQTREANEANEITDITGGSIVPDYDAAGNMTSGPKPGDETTRGHYVYDAWNRLVAVKADDSGDPGDTIVEYRYDGTNRRIERLADFVSGSPTSAAHYFLSGQQTIETREGTPAAAPESLNPKYQNVWSPRYIDSLILRDENLDADGYCDGANDQRLYYLADANYNVTALVKYDSGESEWQVVERYTYTPYGEATIYTPDWSNTREESLFANTTLYTGRELDTATGLYYYRARYYDSSLGRFISRDPIGYEGSRWNLYEYVNSGPTINTDPSGKDGAPTINLTGFGLHCQRGAHATIGIVCIILGPKCNQEAMETAANLCVEECCNAFITAYGRCSLTLVPCMRNCMEILLLGEQCLCSSAGVPL